MLEIEIRINAFVELGMALRSLEKNSDNKYENRLDNLDKLIKEAHLFNPWFTEGDVRYAINSIGESLEEAKIRKWIGNYDLQKGDRSKRVGVVMAGNIPIVGFQDFLCVLMSGHHFLGKLSSDDEKLLPTISELLVDIEPGFNDYITITKEKLESFDAIIATGSNNTARYFEYYFGKYPHIIRKNRNGVAIFTGNESKEDFSEFGKDMFLYFGMGCRSVSKVFVPAGYKFDGFFEAIADYSFVFDNFKYKNNYDYYKSIYLINKTKHFDNGFLLVKEDAAYASPPSVLFYEEYADIGELKKRLNLEKDQIQCIVGNTKEIEEIVSFGKAQHPKLWDYADGVDTMEFLINL